MDVLGKQSPFEVFYGRASNALSQLLDGGLSCQERISPRACDFKSNAERTRKIRSKAKASNNAWEKRYIKRQPTFRLQSGRTGSNPFAGRTRGIPKKRFVVGRTIIKRENTK